MGLLSNILGTGNVIEKGMDLIDKRFPTEVDMIVAKTQAKTDLLTSYAPFKVAQRYLALMFGVTFLASFMLAMTRGLLGLENTVVFETLEAFKLHWIMLTIVGFYFGGGTFEGVIERFKKPK